LWCLNIFYGDVQKHMKDYLKAGSDPCRTFRASVLALLLVASLVGVGCSGQPLTTREKGTLVGGGLGAATGAIVGAAVGSPGVGAAIGGGLGAVGGAVVGNEMQNQEIQQQQTQSQIQSQQQQIQEQQRQIEQLKNQNETE
jgi:outer membrane lipoprotein SlyB